MCSDSIGFLLKPWDHDIYSVVVVIVVGIVAYQNSFFSLLYTKTGDYVGDLYWLPIGY